MLSPEAKTPRGCPRQSACPEADADQLAAGEEEAAAGPAVLGFPADEEGPFLRLSLSSNERASTSRVVQLESRVPRSIPIEVTTESRPAR